MKHLYLASALSIMALIASSAGTSVRAVTFTPPPNNEAPSQATGGASRGMFVPPPSNEAPSQATGGASRGIFTPDPDKGAPSQATGGSSRGDSPLFTPDPRQNTPSQATSGSSRSGDRPSQFSASDPKPVPFPTSTAGASRLGTHNLNPSAVAQGPAALIALLPQTFYGTTISERPTILVYIPASNAQEAVFSLKDQAGQMQYQAVIPVAGQAGVIAIQLPPTAPALTVGKNYQWFLALKVNGELNPSTPYIDGWIQRIEPNAELTAALKQPDALQKAIAFGQHGIWYDCVATLAFLRAQESQNGNLSQQWEELLSSVNLQAVASMPLVVLAR